MKLHLKSLIPPRIRAMLISTVQESLRQRSGSKGAALAFYTLFSMAPVLVLVIAIAGAVFGQQAAQGEIVGQLSGLIGPTGASAIQLLLAAVHSSQSGVVATTIATIALIVGATTVFSELKDSLDEIWYVKRTQTSGFMTLIQTRLLSFGLVLVLAFLLLVSLVISAALAVLQKYWSSFLGDIPIILPFISSLFSFAVIATLFASIYRLLPQTKLPWRDVCIGAIGTAALFIVGKMLIGVYLGNSGTASSYGAAGSVMALLLWIYYSAQIFFFGAQFTRQYALYFGSLRDQLVVVPEQSERPDHANNGDPSGQNKPLIK
ncbi:YihY/virulence factor BrkB family protein [Glaciimonas sp. PAMC28666]|uniref:YihY/virulence factor BrkB family protein n=1 Tax=Glaciimonas sp. PAMC28666 TaxID=2807626 RepID=UPI001966A945|nr:YihY/virulence factor BrkB family protein [Glaciimonas sp. PAMC28666]